MSLVIGASAAAFPTPPIRPETASTRVSPDRPAPVSSRSKPGDRKGAFSRGGVVFSAAAFFAVATGLAMWFVR